jgi:hypothetical protein
LSTACYDKFFKEPLEEGEVAFERLSRFKRCTKEEFKLQHRDKNYPLRQDRRQQAAD